MGFSDLPVIGRFFHQSNNNNVDKQSKPLSATDKKTSNVSIKVDFSNLKDLSNEDVISLFNIELGTKEFTGEAKNLDKLIAELGRRKIPIED